jgi:hypothetical protein
VSPHHPLWLGSLIAGLAIANPVFAASSDEARFEELEQKVKVLERKLEIQQEEAASKAKTAPVIKAGDKGLSFETADGAYQFKLNGLFQGDGRFFIDDNDTAGIEDTFLLRRVRPTLQGQLGKLVAFRLTPEFAGDSATVVDAYVDLKQQPCASASRRGRSAWNACRAVVPSRLPSAPSRQNWRPTATWASPCRVTCSTSA